MLTQNSSRELLCKVSAIGEAEVKLSQSERISSEWY